MKNKKRLDQFLVEKGFFEQRSRARAEVMAGKVMLDEKICDKPGTMVSDSSAIKILSPDNPYVSRGGMKLAGAAEDLPIDFNGKVVLDVGASTGGFTDFILQNGASKVYSVDVGYGQLEWKLRQDPRVINMERTNIRYLKPEDLPEVPDIAVVDVSFISLRKVLPVLIELGVQEIVALVKPQFEAGKEKVGKKGVVRDSSVHQEVLEEIINFAAKLNLEAQGTVPSRLKGPQGNTEFFVYWKKGG